MQWWHLPENFTAVLGIFLILAGPICWQVIADQATILNPRRYDVSDNQSAILDAGELQPVP